MQLSLLANFGGRDEEPRPENAAGADHLARGGVAMDGGMTEIAGLVKPLVFNSGAA